MNERIDPMTGEILMERESVEMRVEEAPMNMPAVVEAPGRLEEKPAVARALPATGFAKIAGAIAAVMKDLTPVEKQGLHEHFRFAYAKMQDLMQELTPLLGKHGLAIIPTEIEKTWMDKQYVSVKYAFTIIHESGEVWPERPEWTGMSLAVNNKGGVDDKCLNKCSTAARKYFLLALFNIPTADVDDADHGKNDAPRQPPKPNVPQTPPSAPPKDAKPHALPTAGMDMSHWVTLYIACISAAPTKEELVQWDKINDAVLTQVSNKEPKLYESIIVASQRREKELAQRKPSGPPPPPPQKTPAPDKDVELVTNGVTPPGEVVWDDPADAMDGQAWLRDFAGALSGCTTAEELETTRKAVGVPAKGKVSQAEWDQGGVLMQAAKNRIALEMGE